MAITDKSEKLEGLSKFWVKAVESAGERSPGVFREFTEDGPVSGDTMDFGWLGNDPVLEEWVGARTIESLKAYGHQIQVKPYQKTVTVDSVELDGDQSGIVQRKLQRGADSIEADLDRLVFEKLIENPTVHDGVALFSTTHVGSGSSTQANSTNVALSHAAYRTARQTMLAYTDERGEPLAFGAPNVLVVGPSNESLAMEIVGPSLTSSAGYNANQGQCKVVVSQRLIGPYEAYWYVFNTNGPVKPMAIGVQKPLAPHDDTSVPFRAEPKYHFSVEGQLAVGPSLWYLSYRSTGA